MNPSNDNATPPPSYEELMSRPVLIVKEKSCDIKKVLQIILLICICVLLTRLILIMDFSGFQARFK